MKNFSLLNRAFLCKWSWHFVVEREAFQKQVISGKYGKKRKGGALRERYRIGWWKAIKKKRDILGTKMAFSLENGKRVRDLKDLGNPSFVYRL